MRRVIALVAAICLCPAPAAAQERIDFLRAYALAQEADPTWLAAQARQRADAQERRIARAGLRPNLAYRYDRARNHSDIRQQNAGGEIRRDTSYDSYASSFTLTQSLFDAVAGARYREGAARSEAGRYTEARARQALAVRVLQAYTDLLFATDDLALAEAQRRMLDEDRQRVERFVALGEGTRTDRAETEAQQHLAAARVIEARDRLRTAQNGLRALIGPAPSIAPAALDAGCVPFGEQLEPVEAWRARLIAHNPELAAQRSMVEVAGHQLRQERAAGLPSVNLFARHQTSDSNSENQIGQHFRTAAAGVQLRLPLYSGGGVSAATTRARAMQQEAQYQLEAATFALIEDLERQYGLVEIGPLRIDAYHKAAAAAAERLHATRRSIAGGERTNLDALDAERQRIEAQRDLARARYDYLLGWLSLRWQAGLLDDADVARVGACFRDTAP